MTEYQPGSRNSAFFQLSDFGVTLHGHFNGGRENTDREAGIQEFTNHGLFDFGFYGPRYAVLYHISHLFYPPEKYKPQHGDRERNPSEVKARRVLHHGNFKKLSPPVDRIDFSYPMTKLLINF